MIIVNNNSYGSDRSNNCIIVIINDNYKNDSNNHDANNVAVITITMTLVFDRL